MTIAAFLTAQLPVRTTKSQCCYSWLYLPHLSWKGRGYHLYMCVHRVCACVCERERGRESGIC